MTKYEDLDQFIEEWLAEQKADTVRRIREKTGWGLMECKTYLNRAKFMRDAEDADSVEKLRELVKTLGNMVQWKLQ